MSLPESLRGRHLHHTYIAVQLVEAALDHGGGVFTEACHE
jgi:hypothetical protein